MSVVWLIADIYEYELPALQPGQEAVVRLSAAPGERLTARAVYLYPTLDPRTCTARVRYTLPNPHGRLKPEMFTEVEIGVSLGARLAVPEGAVIDSGLRRIVFVEAAEGIRGPREVRIGARAGEFLEVIEGLAPGERVVMSANFLIDSESRLRAKPFSRLRRRSPGDARRGLQPAPNPARCHSGHRGCPGDRLHALGGAQP